MSTSEWLTKELGRSRGPLKLVLIAGLAGALLLPMQWVRDLIEERHARMRAVGAELGAQWGRPLALRGPLMIVPRRSGDDYQYLLPRELRVSGQLDVVERYRGIFRYPTYLVRLEITGEFAPPDAPPDDLDWERAAWVLLSDAEVSAGGLEADVEWQGRRSSAEPTPDAFGFSGLAHVSVLAAPPAPGQPLSFRASVVAAGSESLAITPWGRAVSLELAGNWPAPSFAGDRVPTKREVRDDDFVATWDLLQRGTPLVSTTRFPPAYLERGSQLGVRLVDDVSHYQLVTRTAKYALLVIALTFAAFYLFELLAGLHIHVIQYALVGLALVLFYLLLLSQSEHLAFAWSYGSAAAAVVALVTGYTRAILATARHALLCGAGLSAVYGLLFMTLREERFALLAGSWALFLVLASIMYVTRRVDWGSVATAAVRLKQ